MYAQSSPVPFDDPDWIFESKLDGYRTIAIFDEGVGVRLWSRNGLSFDSRYPLIRDELKMLKLRSTVLNGEIVALDEAGVPHFELLQRWQKRLRSATRIQRLRFTLVR